MEVYKYTTFDPYNKLAKYTAPIHAPGATTSDTFSTTSSPTYSSPAVDRMKIVKTPNSGTKLPIPYPMIGPPQPFVYTRPSTYNTVENDPEARMDIIKMFRRLLIDEWLVGDLKYLLDKIRVSGDTKTKIHHLKKKIITLENMAQILYDLNKKYKIRWIDFPHDKPLVKRKIEKYILKKIKKG